MKKVWFKIHGFLITNTVIFAIVSIFLDWTLYFLLWWLPAFTYYSLIIRIRNIAEHCVTSGSTDFDNTRTTLTNPFVRFLMAPHGVNYHLEHHLFMMCPWYNLPKAHSMMIENGYSYSIKEFLKRSKVKIFITIINQHLSYVYRLTSICVA